MSLIDLRTAEAVKTSKGSPYAIYAEVDTLEPYALVSPVSWKKLPLTADSNRAAESNDEATEIEDGASINLTSEESTTFATTFAQQDLATKKFIEFDSKGKVYAIIKEEHVVPVKDAAGTSQYQYLVIPAARRQSGFTRNAKSVETEVTWDILSISGLATLTGIPNATTSGFKATLPSTVAVDGTTRNYDLVGVTA